MCFFIFLFLTNLVRIMKFRMQKIIFQIKKNSFRKKTFLFLNTSTITMFPNVQKKKTIKLKYFYTSNLGKDINKMLRVYNTFHSPPTISRLERERKRHMHFFLIYIFKKKVMLIKTFFCSYPKEENALIRSLSLFLFCQL